MRSWSRVWEWPIPPNTYVDPEVVREYVEEEAERGVHVDPGEVRAYFERETGGIRTRFRTSPGLVAVAVGLATLLVLAVWVLPPVLAGKGESENDVRSTLLQGVAGLVLAAGLYFTAQTLRLNRESAARTYLLEHEGQITERFTRAIDQIGVDRPVEVRLGGIYALERIARESPDDHGPIMEVLTAYVRENARSHASAEEEAA